MPKVSGAECVYLINKLIGDPSAYIGSTINKNKRFKSYVNKHPKRYVEYSIKKYGWDSFQKIEIDVNAKDEKELRMWENFYIGLFGTHKDENPGFGMNIIRNPTLAPSKDKEVAKRISASKKGKKMSEEQKQKISKSTKGIVNIGIKRPYLSERNKIVKPALGRTGDKHPMSKKIFYVTDNKIFNSLTEAGDYFGISRQAVRSRIKYNPEIYIYQ